MGYARFSGPVYGAKGTMLTGYQAAISSGGGNGMNSTILSVVVPVGEQWYATDLLVYRKSTGSTGMACTLRLNSSVIATVNLNSSLADASSKAEIAPDGGEKEGTLLDSGQTVSLQAVTSSVCSTSSDLTMIVRGYTRYLDSSRYAF